MNCLVGYVYTRCLIISNSCFADFEFVSDPPSISAFDLDVVKLTAMFVARNGRQFLTSLMQKEQRNYQFDFLRPQHSLFQYFTRLLEQYTRVMIPPRDAIRRLEAEAEDEGKVLSQVDYRVRWVKAQEAKKRREEEEAERERVSYAQVDWHNFVVVETVDYQPWEVSFEDFCISQCCRLMTIIFVRPVTSLLPPTRLRWAPAC